MSQISVVVPVYNTADYLPKCLDSLINQTLADIENILIDDDSEDDSGRICDRYAACDPRIRSIHIQHAGLAAARNHGIDLAESAYIMFVDSDDWVEPDFCLKPYTAAMENNADLVVFRYNRIQQNKKPQKGDSFVHDGIIEKGTVITNDMVWNKLFKKKLFDKIRFPSDRMYEDVGTTYKLIHIARKVYGVSDCLYNYRVRRPGSITSFFTKKPIYDRYHMLAVRIRDLRKWGYDDKRDQESFAWGWLVTFGRKGRIGSYSAKKIRSLKQYPEFFTNKEKAAFHLFRFSPPLFDLACILTGRRISNKEK